MHWFHVGLVTFALLMALGLVVRYVFWSLDQNSRHLARLEQDGPYREEELARLDRLVEQDPNRAETYRRRADLHRFEGNWSAVKNDLERAVVLQPKDDILWYELAEALLELRQPLQAGRALEKASALDPRCLDYPPLHVRIALVEKNRKAAQEGLARWQSLVDERSPRGRNRWNPHVPTADPKRDPELALHRAAVCLLCGDVEDARKAVREAESLGGAYDWREVRKDPAFTDLAALVEA